MITKRYGPDVASAGIHPRQSSAEDTDDLPHVDLGPEMNTIFWLLTSLALAFLLLRLYCKFLRGRRFWWDDYVLIAAWVRSDPNPSDIKPSWSNSKMAGFPFDILRHHDRLCISRLRKAYVGYAAGGDQ